MLRYGQLYGSSNYDELNELFQKYSKSNAELLEIHKQYFDLPDDKALGHFKDRERKVLCMRYGLADGTEHTLEEVGQSMGVTRERIRQIEKKAIDKLGKVLERRKLF